MGAVGRAQLNQDITLSAGKFIQLLQFMEQVGLDAAAIAASLNLSSERIVALDSRRQLPAVHYARLWKTAVLQMQALGKPIPWAAGVGSDSFEFLIRSISTAHTLGEALTLAQRYDALLLPTTGYHVSLLEDENPERVRLRYQVTVDENTSMLAPDSWRDRSQQVTIAHATGLLVWHDICGWLTGRALELDCVRISAPFIGEAYQRRMNTVFQCPVHFHESENTITFARSELQRLVIQSRESLDDFLENTLYHLISVERRATNTASVIRSLISNHLSGGEGELPSFVDVADMLHLSSSSLRRRLQREGTNYQLIKDEVRRDIAIDRLLSGHGKVGDIGEYLGFADPSSFVRSFKQWTGFTPVEYQSEYRDITQAV